MYRVALARASDRAPGSRRSAAREASLRQPHGLALLQGASAEAPAAGAAEAPPPADLCGEPLSFFWSHPESGTRLAAYGESVRREATSPGELREVLAALTRPDSVL